MMLLLPREVQHIIADCLTARTRRLVLRGTKTYTLYMTISLARFVWKLIFK